MKDHLTAEAVWRDGKLDLVDPVVFHASLRKMQPGDGETFIVTVVRGIEKVTRKQRAYYYAAIVNPLVEYTGYSKAWWHGVLKVLFFPDDGRTSITELSKSEMVDYTSTCEEFARTEMWEAFEPWDSRYPAAA